MINLGTAILAANVVSLFQGEIGKYAVLAVLMPIVAGMGGNAGTQTLAVAVRALATNNSPVQYHFAPSFASSPLRPQTGFRSAS